MSKKKRATVGERIARSVWFTERGEMSEAEHRQRLARRIDAAARRAVRKEMWRCLDVLGAMQLDTDRILRWWGDQNRQPPPEMLLTGQCDNKTKQSKRLSTGS